MNLPAEWAQVYEGWRFVNVMLYPGQWKAAGEKFCKIRGMSNSTYGLLLIMGHAASGPAVIFFLLVSRKLEIQNGTASDAAFVGLDSFRLPCFLFVPTLRGK